MRGEVRLLRRTRKGLEMEFGGEAEAEGCVEIDGSEGWVWDEDYIRVKLGMRHVMNTQAVLS